MAIKPVNIYWGQGYANELQLNDQDNYICATYGLFDGPEQDIVLGTTDYGVPFDITGNLKERVFSMTVSVMGNSWSSDYNQRRNTLLAALYSGRIKIQVSRTGVGNLYLLARVEQPKEEQPGVFNITFTAADPIFTLDEEDTQVIWNTGLDGGVTGAFDVYTGSAPAEPVIEINVNDRGYIWKNYNLVTITNRFSKPLVQYPIRISLGDIYDVTGNPDSPGDDPSIYKYWETGGGVVRIKDILIESQGGQEVNYWLFDEFDAFSGHYHTNVYLWILVNIPANSSIDYYIIYNNQTYPLSPSHDIYDIIKPMFLMNSTSDNHRWDYFDFRALNSQSPRRTYQWVPYADEKYRISDIDFMHPAYPQQIADDAPAPDHGTKVAIHSAGAYVTVYGTCNGVAGLAFPGIIPIETLLFTWKASTNAKFTLNCLATRPDDRKTYDWVRPNSFHVFDSTMHSYISSDAIETDDVIYVSDLTSGSVQWETGNKVFITADDGTTIFSIITGVNLTVTENGYEITLYQPVGKVVSAGRTMQVYESDSDSVLFADGDRPSTVAFVGKANFPQYNLGDWYFAALDSCSIVFDANLYPLVSFGTEVDLTTDSYQIRAAVGNALLAEYLLINTILPNPDDKLVIDCKERTVTYYNGTIDGDTGTNRRESVVVPAVRRYWVHIDPGYGVPQNIIFTAASEQFNFINLSVKVTYPTRFY